MDWVIYHEEYGMFSGNGWTKQGFLAQRYEDGDEAQQCADALHLANCNFDHTKARDTESEYEVRDLFRGQVRSETSDQKQTLLHKRNQSHLIRGLQWIIICMKERS